MIKYNLIGEGELTLVFIHGNSSSKETFSEQVRYFQPDYQILTLDLYGHGESDHLKNAENDSFIYSTDFHAESIIEVLEHLALKNYVLIGHSYGGHVAINLSRRNLKHLKGIFIVNTTPMNDVNDLTKAFNQIDGGDLIFKYEVNDGDIEKLVNIFGITKEIEHFIKAFKSTDPYFRKNLATSISENPNLGEKNALNSLSIPVQVNFSADEKLLNGDYINSLAHDLPKSKVITTNLRGHFPHIQEPEKFNLILQDFILQSKMTKI